MIWKPIFFAVVCFAFFAVSPSYAQEPTPCPADRVCVTREAALKALADADTVKAQAAEIAVKDKAIDDLKELLAKMRIEFAAASGELTALKQNAVSDRAIIDLLLKQVRKKCMPFSVCF